MLRHIYRAIILIAIFVAALSYFSRDIKEVVFDLDNTTTMEEATFPLVTIQMEDTIINLLHGYSTNLDANKIRETVIPLDKNQTFEVRIDYKSYDIKKLNYEVRDFVDNSLIETDSVSVFEEDQNIKTAKIKLKGELQVEQEYALKITLITSESKKMYYYQRIKIYENAHLKDKLDFILDFHQAIMDKTTAESIIKYLEPSRDADNSSLAYVNINSSFELVSWGNIKPKVLTEVIPEVKEIYRETASVELKYFIEADVSGNKELYRVTEFYRVRYTPDRMYLLGYERHMESVFDILLTSNTHKELKLGITENPDVPYVAGKDKTKVAFVRNRELWFYDLQNNKITKVFSFRQDNTDYIRDLYDQHDIRILNMDAEGNLDFMVYGYMNRGQYEGKVAVILYHFIRAENRIEELVYIPVEEPYQRLKENIGELAYVNAKDVFYFHIYNTIYSYDLITKELTEIATDVSKNQVVVLKNVNYVAWQDKSDPKLSKNIYILDLESGKIDTISAKAGYNIRLMDIIDSNIIYGYVNEGDIASMIDGSMMAPLSTLEIASVNKELLKTYSLSGYYISGLEVKDNIIELRLVQKNIQDGRMIYSFAKLDHIMNKVKVENELVKTIARTSDEALTEYYLSLPTDYKTDQPSDIMTTVSTVISQDPTVRLPETESKLLCYYPYITGGIAGSFDNAASAIQVAKDRQGTVLNSNNQIVWERVVKASSVKLEAIEQMDYAAVPNNTLAASLQVLLAYQNIDKQIDQLITNNTTAYDVLKSYSKYTPIRLTGVPLEDILYYLSKGRPIIAMINLTDAVVIYGYDSFNIMIYNPATGKTVKMGMQDSKQLFEGAGNVFLSYLE